MLRSVKGRLECMTVDDVVDLLHVVVGVAILLAVHTTDFSAMSSLNLQVRYLNNEWMISSGLTILVALGKTLWYAVMSVGC